MPREILVSKSLNSAIFLQVDGGAEGIRTPYLLVANEALSLLSYSPITLVIITYTVVGFKPVGQDKYYTSGFLTLCTIEPTI